ncbi:PEP-CTERM sorting domain-containing protein [Armatimonas sp.]|uniref:PEP-CTERM sorting domain-containing protein n=1 Tax=Armatimonas sp. TaxID=1872638 RepID=UPI003751441E
MRKILGLAIVLSLSGTVWAQSFTVVPTAAVGVDGNSGTNTPIRSVARTLQVILSASELGGISVGDTLEGIAFRLDNTEISQPPFDLNFASYDIFLGQAALTPTTMSSTFADNYLGGTRVQMRNGSLMIAQGSLPFGGNPNSFGPQIVFNLSGGKYTYVGGDLVLELRHTGNAASDFQLDASLNNAVAAARVGNTSTATIEDATLGPRVPVMRLQFTSMAPEPGSLALLGLGAGIGLLVRRRTCQA